MTHGSPFGSCGCSNGSGSASIIADTFAFLLFPQIQVISDFRLPIADFRFNYHPYFGKSAIGNRKSAMT
jgi:hypothetical protein